MAGFGAKLRIVPIESDDRIAACNPRRGELPRVLPQHTPVWAAVPAAGGQ